MWRRITSLPRCGSEDPPRFPRKRNPNQTGFDQIIPALDKLEAEFLFYQATDVPEKVLNLERIDEQWAALAKETGPLNQLLYSRLGQCVLGILT
ncbi:hypothetical protein HNY73_021849 [Argiope bruennichi]|uniref:Uncharacterized protein n=1 Tax=Argiope bruennichi TaxID=94029 RepID=A0A8T0DZT6_ARGBR|nr:hypothetical protein HNY73_021849 [Argiope bruennichi]